VADIDAGHERIRAAEVMAALSLATDLGIGAPLEHGLQSTLVAMRLAEHLDVDAETASQTYYTCLLLYVGCTADAEIAAEVFGDETAAEHLIPAIFGSRADMMAAVIRALPTHGAGPFVSTLQVARGLPKAARGNERHLVALCEVAQMLTARLGLPASVQGLFAHLTERWDGKGFPGRAQRDAIPLPVRISHVARDATFQRMLGGDAFALSVVRKRAGGAFDPAIVARLGTHAAEIFDVDAAASVWDETLAREPTPHLFLHDESIDQALAAMGDFADLASPYLVGHSAGVAGLAVAAAEGSGLPHADVVTIRRAALVHDVGRVGIPARVWHKAGPLSADEWERVRLHAYHSERILSRSPMLARLVPVATYHHERLDGSGYHRGATSVTLARPARLLAAADAYHAMTEPRPHRDALSAERAAAELEQESSAGRLDADSASAVLQAAGHRAPRMERPAGLSAREAQVVGLLARGLQTKQIARALGISIKTADRHIQHAYAKIGISSRAAAALFAMQHGLVTWGELPLGRASGRS
jgi:HD-GYP domain-containing protein (c-di-GMP phosphodiesterase class II)